MVSRVASSSFGSHSCCHSRGLSSIGNSAKFIEPMLSEHISGSRLQRRGQPLVERHQRRAAGGDVDHRVGRLLDARQELHEHRQDRRSGGRPSGSRACRCRIEAPASAAAIASAAIWSGVTGRCGRHRRRVHRAGDGAGDDDFSWRHLSPQPSTGRSSSAASAASASPRMATISPICSWRDDQRRRDHEIVAAPTPPLTRRQ